MEAGMLGMLIGIGMTISSCDWVHPHDKDVRTIYYQGINASQTQVSKYTGSRGFIATTGEHVVCKRAFDVIENPFIGKELDEIQLKKIYAKKGDEIKAFFQHPIRVLEQCVNSVCENKMFGITITHTGFEPMETLEGHAVRTDLMSLGQTIDIEEHRKRYNLCREQYPDSDIILYGVSRGAATTFDAAACNHYDMDKVKLIVLEACFDSVSSAAHNSPIFFHAKKIEKAFIKILSKKMQFNNKGVAPIKLVNVFPAGVPVLFITSKSDKIVPECCVRRLANALEKRGKNPIYLLVLEHSSHPKYMMDNKQDAENYRDCLHALYKHLDLPYVPKFAHAGENKRLLECCLL